MNYFAGINTLKVLKIKYRELCKLNHPDLGGSTSVMQEINAQYERMLSRVHDDKGEILNDEAINIEKDLMEVINKIIALKGLVIEVTGRWIWITGQTYTYKDFLKSLGCFWAHKKAAWYWRPQDAKVWNRHPLSLEAIRSKYGTISIGTVDRQALA
jgi:hypothetical protein